MMKRARDKDGSSIEDGSLEMAKCLIQISNSSCGSARVSSNNIVERMFKCKSCERAFTSFQALGGHRASHHKKPKLMTTSQDITKVVKVKVKSVHECSICGIKFRLGQALGGHMRRHRIEVKGEVVGDHHAMSRDDAQVAEEFVPILMRSLSMNRRIMCMDLNLTPLENDLQLLFGKKAPKVDCKLVV